MLDHGSWEARIERRSNNHWESVIDPDHHSTGSCNSPIHQAGAANVELSRTVSDKELRRVDPGDRLTLVRSTRVEQSVLWQGVIKATAGRNLSADNHIGEGGLAQILNKIDSALTGETVVQLGSRIIAAAILRAPQLVGVRVLPLDLGPDRRLPTTWTRDPDQDEFTADSLSALADLNLIYASWGSSIWVGCSLDTNVSSRIERSDWVAEPEYGRSLSPLASAFRLRQGLVTVDVEQEGRLLIEKVINTTGRSEAQIKTEADRLLAVNANIAGITLLGTSTLGPTAPSASVLAPGSLHVIELDGIVTTQRLVDIRYAWSIGSEMDSERTKNIGATPTFLNPTADPYRLNTSSVEALNFSVAERLSQRVRLLESAERSLQRKQDALLTNP